MGIEVSNLDLTHAQPRLAEHGAGGITCCPGLIYWRPQSTPVNIETLWHLEASGTADPQKCFCVYIFIGMFETTVIRRVSGTELQNGLARNGPFPSTPRAVGRDGSLPSAPLAAAPRPAPSACGPGAPPPPGGTPPQGRAATPLRAALARRARAGGARRRDAPRGEGRALRCPRRSARARGAGARRRRWRPSWSLPWS